MSLLQKLKRYIVDADYRFIINDGLGLYRHMSDKKYLVRKFRLRMGYPLDLENPVTFNEKIQWLKIYDRKPEYTRMVDKYEVKKYVAEIIGSEYIVPTIGMWDSPEDIDFDRLPDKFVLKCNHNSGLGMCICKDKAQLNIAQVRCQLQKGLKQDYYLTGREWPYKDVHRCIIAEQFLEPDTENLSDYKIHCFNGLPKLILVCKDRFCEQGVSEDFFDVNWEHLAIKRPDIRNAGDPIQRPENLEKMLEIARILSNRMPFSRVDFYEVKGKVYFGEITFFPASGFKRYEPDKWDEILGSWIELPSKTEN